MARSRKGSLVQSKINMLLFGTPFTGKSTMALQLAYFKNTDGKPFKVLYLDPESGSVDDYLEGLQENGVNLDNIYIVYTQSVGEVREYIRKAKDNEDYYELDDDGNETDIVVTDAEGNSFRPDAIVVDGTSILNLTTKQGLIEFSKKRSKVKADRDGLIGDEKLVKIEGAGLELKDYQTVNFKGQDLILDLAGSGKHYIVTARETDEMINKEINGKEVRVATGKKIPDGFKGMDYNVKTLVRMFRDENRNVMAYVEKDRTNVHKDCETLEDPSLLDWTILIDRGVGRKEFVIQNNLSKSVEIEHNIYTKELVGETPEETSTKTTANEADVLIKEIEEAIGKLTPVKKSEMKKKVTEAKLPTNFKKETNVETLNKIFEIVKNS
jgi:hypothetical protein